jgi:hypothetical protein
MTMTYPIIRMIKSGISRAAATPRVVARWERPKRRKAVAREKKAEKFFPLKKGAASGYPFLPKIEHYEQDKDDHCKGIQWRREFRHRDSRFAGISDSIPISI